MPMLQWNEKYSVGVQAMDEQHRIMISALNELNEAMTTTHDAMAGEHLLDKLLSHTHHHFNHEDELLEAAAFPGAASHRRHHADLRRAVTGFMGHYGGPALNVDLMFFLRDWLKVHILVQDKTYVPWMKKQGIQ